MILIARNCENARISNSISNDRVSADTERQTGRKMLNNVADK